MSIARTRRPCKAPHGNTLPPHGNTAQAAVPICDQGGNVCLYSIQCKCGEWFCVRVHQPDVPAFDRHRSTALDQVLVLQDALTQLKGLLEESLL